MNLVKYHSPLSRRVFDPFDDLERLFGDMIGGLNTTSSDPSTHALSMRMDVKETETGYEISADMPGVEKKDLHITCDDGMLTITAEKKAKKEDKEANYHRVERSYGKFYRQIALPKDADDEKAEAIYENGVLHMALPKHKAEKQAAKRLTVK